MLGTLASWLRCFGYDTSYAANDSTDDDLIKQAKKQQQLLITRDKELVQRAKKQGIKTIAITSDNLDEQLKTVLSQSLYDKEALFSRCLGCNSVLKKVPMQQAHPHVPLGIRKIHKEFWFCPHCKKYFWRGSHYDNMKEKICSLLRSLD